MTPSISEIQTMNLEQLFTVNRKYLESDSIVFDHWNKRVKDVLGSGKHEISNVADYLNYLSDNQFIEGIIDQNIIENDPEILNNLIDIADKLGRALNNIIEAKKKLLTDGTIDVEFEEVNNLEFTRKETPLLMPPSSYWAALDVKQRLENLGYTKSKILFNEIFYEKGNYHVNISAQYNLIMIHKFLGGSDATTDKNGNIQQSNYYEIVGYTKIESVDKTIEYINSIVKDTE